MEVILDIADNFSNKKFPSLLTLSTRVICKNLHLILEPSSSHELRLRDGVFFSKRCMESFLFEYQKLLLPTYNHEIDPRLIDLLMTSQNCQLKNIFLLQTHLPSIFISKVLKKHNITELTTCLGDNDSTEFITKCKSSLRMLSLDFKLVNQFSFPSIVRHEKHNTDLTSLSLLNINVGFLVKVFCSRIFDHTPNLRFLDISGLNSNPRENDPNPLDFSILNKLHHLESLVVCDVSLGSNLEALEHIKSLQFLRHLDISCPNSTITRYSEQAITNLTQFLLDMPLLNSLDVSNTDIFKRFRSTVQFTKVMADRPFKFLGLLRCAGNPCTVSNIPADQVTGHANVEQIECSIYRYLDRINMLTAAVNELFDVISSDRENIVRREGLLELLLSTLQYYCIPADPFIRLHMSVSACLYHFARYYFDRRSQMPLKLRNELLRVLIETMYRNYKSGPSYTRTLQRNCVLTLVLFDSGKVLLTLPWTTLKKLLLTLGFLIKMEDSPTPFHEMRMSLYLLNSLVCHMSHLQKKLAGKLGLIHWLYDIVAESEFDHTNERGDVAADFVDFQSIAWSALWNATDETPTNCKAFVHHGSLRQGLEIFKEKIWSYREKTEAARNNYMDTIRNMMGLMGNIAEVADLRPDLYDPELLKIFIDLLDEIADSEGDIEISYNSAGVLANLLSDGEHGWPYHEPDFFCINCAKPIHWSLKDFITTSDNDDDDDVVKDHRRIDCDSCHASHTDIIVVEDGRGDGRMSERQEAAINCNDNDGASSSLSCSSLMQKNSCHRHYYDNSNNIINLQMINDDLREINRNCIDHFISGNRIEESKMATASSPISVQPSEKSIITETYPGGDTIIMPDSTSTVKYKIDPSMETTTIDGTHHHHHMVVKPPIKSDAATIPSFSSTMEAFQYYQCLENEIFVGKNPKALNFPRHRLSRTRHRERSMNNNNNNNLPVEEVGDSNNETDDEKDKGEKSIESPGEKCDEDVSCNNKEEKFVNYADYACELGRRKIQQKIIHACRQWNFTARRYINYRSFKPILRLLEANIDDSPGAQYWALWAIANLSHHDGARYVPLLKSEKANVHLKRIEEIYNNKESIVHRFVRFYDLDANTMSETDETESSSASNNESITSSINKLLQSIYKVQSEYRDSQPPEPYYFQEDEDDASAPHDGDNGDAESADNNNDTIDNEQSFKDEGDYSLSRQFNLIEFNDSDRYWREKEEETAMFDDTCNNGDTAAPGSSGISLYKDGAVASSSSIRHTTTIDGNLDNNSNTSDDTSTDYEDVDDNDNNSDDMHSTMSTDSEYVDHDHDDEMIDNNIDGNIEGDDDNELQMIDGENIDDDYDNQL